LPVIFDVIEFVAVFLLAVEAIKLENLRTLVDSYLKPLYVRLNPQIKIVDDTSGIGFWERHAITFTFITFYVIGLCIIFAIFNNYNIDANELLKNAKLIYWIFSMIGLLIVPLVVGFMPYQAVVWFFELSIKALTWVQLKSYTGIVGILGFFLFTIQYWGRRVWLS
jgi:putative effector of murein hydrolase LrgA (UPF0299 family)